MELRDEGHMKSGGKCQASTLLWHSDGVEQSRQSHAFLLYMTRRLEQGLSPGYQRAPSALNSWTNDFANSVYTSSTFLLKSGASKDNPRSWKDSEQREDFV